MSIDAAVRAALSQHPLERRSFVNEDDMEGPRAAIPDVPAVAPAP